MNSFVEGKAGALAFLGRLEETLRSKLPSRSDMKSRIPKMVAAAKDDDKKTHLRSPETAFLNGMVLPLLHEQLLHEQLQNRRLTEEDARESLLNEYCKTMQDISRQSPSRSQGHPFQKILGKLASEIYQRWTTAAGNGFAQSCPDFALQNPFPHSIVFEGKYFRRGSTEVAQNELVSDIYQAFFYRSLSPIGATKNRAGWRYDYSCLLAYDASPSGSFLKSWQDIPLRTRENFWEGANLYVIVLGGSAELPPAAR